VDNRINIGIALATFTAAVLALAKTQGENIQIANFFGLAALLAVLLVSPLIGLVVLVPVALLAWFKYYKHVLDFFNSMRRE